MRLSQSSTRFVLACLAVVPLAARGQQMPNPYGESVGVDVARRAAAAAVAEARKNGWTVAVTIVDTHGDLVFFERMDNTQYGSTRVSMEKARSAAQFKRPTKTFEDGVKGQNVNQLGLSGAVPLEGGIPIVMNGKIVGAIGVSGGTSPQDGVCAKAGLDAIVGAGHGG